MNNLTSPLLKAKKLSQLQDFNMDIWNSYFMDLAEELGLKYTWGIEEEENWGILESNTLPLVIHNTNLPFAFYLVGSETHSFINSDKIDCVVVPVNNWNECVFSLEAQKVADILNWRTNQVNRNCFSIMDLLYATH